MTREDFFRAVGEVREDQIEAAEAVKKQVHPWRRGMGRAVRVIRPVVGAVQAPRRRAAAALLFRKAGFWKHGAVLHPGHCGDYGPHPGRPDGRGDIQPSLAGGQGGTGGGGPGVRRFCGAFRGLRLRYGWLRRT